MSVARATAMNHFLRHISHTVAKVHALSGSAELPTQHTTSPYSW